MPGQNMLTQNVKIFDPWMPDIDPRRSEKPRLIAVQNIVDDIDGPRSAFGSNFVNWNFWDIATRGKVDELPIANDILYGTQTGVWTINQTTGLAEPLLLVTLTKTFWPWTIAYVGGLYYICQYDIGLWQYDPVAQSIKHITTPFGEKARGLIRSFGRLIVITDTAAAVSALDNGTDFTPSLATAAQAQALSLVGGTALRLDPLPDGWILSTTNGIMKATYTEQAYVFSYDCLTNAIKLTSPNAGVYIEGLGAILLDPSGFHIVTARSLTASGYPAPWEIEKGDYIKKNILNLLNANLYGTVDLFWSVAEQKLFVSFSGNSPEGVHNACFVYTLVSQRWGSFDTQHTGIFETYSAINDIYTCSYMGIDGFMHSFNNSDYTQILPTNPYVLQDYVFRPGAVQTTELGVVSQVNVAGVTFDLGTTELNLSEVLETAFGTLTASGPYYLNYTPYSDTANDSQNDPGMTIGNPIIGGTYINMDVSGGVELYAIGYSVPVGGLNSFLTVGPFRFTDQIAADETSSVDTVLIGIAGVSNFNVTEDWNVLLGSEDWNALGGSEDWNTGAIDPNNFDLVLRSSDDGISMPVQGDEDLQIFANKGSMFYYKPQGYSGLMHQLTLSAEDAGQAFALKTLDLTGLATGRTMFG